MASIRSLRLGINKSHPLAQGLVAFVTIEDGWPVDLVSGRPCRVAPGYTAAIYNAGKEGPRYRNINPSGGTYGFFFDLDSPVYIDRGSHSLFAFGTDSGTTTARKDWIALGSQAPASHLFLASNNGSSYGVCGYVDGTTDGIWKRTTVDLTGSNNKLALSWTAGGTSPTVWLNGSTGGSEFQALSNINTTAATLLSFSTNPGNTVELAGGLYAGGYWSRALTDADVAMLQSDCLQHVGFIGRYPRAIFIDLAAAQTGPTVYEDDLEADAGVDDEVSALFGRLGHPRADVSNTGWLPSSGSDLYPMVDEGVREDSDYVYTTAPAVARIALTQHADPGDTVHAIKIASPAGYSPSGTLVVRLYCGATQIAEWTITDLSADDERTLTLTAGERDSITDYTALEIELEAVAV